VGIERGGPAVLHAVPFEKLVREVTIEGSIESWMDVVRTRLCKSQLNQIVPGALTRYDLPDLVKAIAPRKVAVRRPIHPTGKLKAE
jgi:hypothetical protein